MKAVKPNCCSRCGRPGHKSPTCDQPATAVSKSVIEAVIKNLDVQITAMQEAKTELLNLLGTNSEDWEL